MAEEYEPVEREPERDATALTRRARRESTSSSSTRPPARAPRPAKPAASRPAKAAVAAKPSPAKRDAAKHGGARPLRSVVIISMVVGLIATVALPAYAAWQPEEEAVTAYQDSVDDAQGLIVASDATAVELERSSYAATTADEIARKKAAEAAAERARELASRAASATTTTLSSIDLSMTAPGSGEVRWPLAGYTLGRGLWDSGYHQGVDLLTSCGQPIFAAAAGVVRVSQESFGGYGVAVTIDHAIGGQRVNTLYGHMTYGSRVVQSGETVAAGQLIGLIGSTGSSTACHLHFEVHINESVVDPYAWLQANAS